jgi:hypothetical protein
VLRVHVPPRFRLGTHAAPSQKELLGQPPQMPPPPQTWHGSLHAVAQQTPLTQSPVAHWVDVVQPKPLARLQPPAPSHADEPVHGVVATGSGLPAGTGLHIPTRPATVQAMQVPVQAPSQQTPSAQWPLGHALSVAHDDAITRT